MSLEILPADIRNLPVYTVTRELFISTTILLIMLLIGAIAFAVVWVVRSCKRIYNYEYIPYH